MNGTPRELTRNHSRLFQNQKYVYPVVSRRSRGLSIGINISPTCLCNFLCTYCQVNGVYRQQRESHTGTLTVDLAVLEQELRKTVAAALDGTLFEIPEFAQIPLNQRHFNDIAFSGDGEPTLSPMFRETMQTALNVHQELCPETVKIVLITNATTFHLPQTAETLSRMMEHHGEIWAKLDAGTEDLYRRINRSKVPFFTVLRNLEMMSQWKPIVIQSIFLSQDGVSPPPEQIGYYIDRLKHLLDIGGRIDRVQLYTIARSTLESWVSPLREEQMEAISEQVSRETGLTAEVFC
ncbi:MAG: radical SAM protein [Planctomycetaceae bacterium]|jgi:wyosine [tRNA(Phe)-imidazoG37] synthetase (radical SAM superfamily)|nr:radical SAM protein [Planctomycetaceae bacterium]